MQPSGYTVTILSSAANGAALAGGKQVFQVETGVKGAHRIVTRTFAGRDEAEAYAARVRRSNSIGSYWAEVTELPADEADNDPCDCGTVFGPRGFYLLHAPGDHADCTGTGDATDALADLVAAADRFEATAARARAFRSALTVTA